MLLTLVAIFSTAYSLTYKVGETFSYTYSSDVSTIAAQEGEDDQVTTTKLTCQANFKVLATNTRSSYLEMVISNVRTAASVNDEGGDGQYDADSEEAMARPIYFTQLADGTIDDVNFNEEDEADVVDSKVGILFSLRTTIGSTSTGDYEQHEINDPVGSHYEHFNTRMEGSRVVVSSHFDTDDMISFSHESETNQVKLECSSTRELVNGKVYAAASAMTVVLNPEATDQGANEEEAPLAFVTSGRYDLTNFAHGNSDGPVDFPFASIEQAMNARPGHRTRHFGIRRYPKPVIRKLEEKWESDSLDGLTTCPAGIDLCKSYDKTWSVGNNNAGLTFRVSFVAGMKKGCTDPSRSYIVGAYANIDVLLLSKTISAAEAIVEYGQVGGSPLRNTIQLKVFGATLYSKTLPYFDCKAHSQSLINVNKEFAFSYTIVVYVVPITFRAGIKLGFSASLTWTVCVNDLKASISVVPTATATVFGSAAANLLLVQAGIELSGTVSDNLDPTAYIDGNLCKVGFTMYNNLNPITVKLQGFYQFRTLSWFKWTWGSKHYLTIWSHSWSGLRSKILDIYYGAK